MKGKKDVTGTGIMLRNKKRLNDTEILILLLMLVTLFFHLPDHLDIKVKSELICQEYVAEEVDDFHAVETVFFEKVFTFVEDKNVLSLDYEVFEEDGIIHQTAFIIYK